MSSPIPPTIPPIDGSITVRQTPKADATRAGAFAQAAPITAPVSLQTIPLSPPQQVLDEMASAARTHDALRSQGRELHFTHDAQSGCLTIEVRDNGGHVLRTISPSEALEVAAGKPLE